MHARKWLRVNTKNKAVPQREVWIVTKTNRVFLELKQATDHYWRLLRITLCCILQTIFSKNSQFKSSWKGRLIFSSDLISSLFILLLPLYLTAWVDFWHLCLWDLLLLVLHHYISSTLAIVLKNVVPFRIKINNDEIFLFSKRILLQFFSAVLYSKIIIADEMINSGECVRVHCSL